MARASKPGQRAQSIKVTTFNPGKKATGCTRGRMGLLMRDSGQTTKLTVTEFISGKMDASTTDSGPTTTCRATAFTSTQTESGSTDSISKTKRRATGYTTGPTAANTKATGIKANSTG